jgi:hypothetical protein
MNPCEYWQYSYIPAIQLSEIPQFRMIEVDGPKN